MVPLTQALGPEESSIEFPSRYPKIALLTGIAIVAASTAILPSITGYGTVLFQVVMLGAWVLLASVTSGMFADQHHYIVFPIAVLLNVFLFSLCALPTYLVFRRRALTACTIALLAWLVFYLCCLFFLFPATDGP